jgi:hypothetical protein
MMIHISYEITFMVNVLVLRKIVQIDEETSASPAVPRGHSKS